MIGGMKKTASRLALVAGASVLATSAMAADLGGDCCADLEERIAELEATTVRKGNRVVSVTLYGQVSRAMIWHDDDVFGTERDSFVFIDNDGRSGTRFGLRGSGKVSSDISIGYRIEMDVDGNNRSGSTRRDDSFGVRLAHVYVDSKMYGRVTLGQQSEATDGIANIALGGPFTPTSADGDSDVSDHAAAVTPGIDGGRVEGIRYTSPVFAGFTFSAFYGQEATHKDEEDTWDVALRYANEFNGVRIAAGIGYRDEEKTDGSDVETLALSASLLHVPTGIYVNGAYGNVEDTGTEAVTATFLAPGINMGDLSISNFDFDVWYVGVGVVRKWFPIGATTIGFDYGEVHYDGLNDFDARFDDDGRYFGVGMTQNIDSTATDLYFLYRNYELNNNVDIDSVNVFTAGMRVKF